MKHPTAQSKVNNTQQSLKKILNTPSISLNNSSHQPRYYPKRTTLLIKSTSKEVDFCYNTDLQSKQNVLRLFEHYIYHF